MLKNSYYSKFLNKNFVFNAINPPSEKKILTLSEIPYRCTGSVEFVSSRINVNFGLELALYTQWCLLWIFGDLIIKQSFKNKKKIQ